MKKIGLIINPVAGIGGKVGLKGSDGEAVLNEALKLGAIPESGKKALNAVRIMKNVQEEIDVFTCCGEMGANVCENAGLKYKLISTVCSNHTSPKDTIDAAKILADMKMDLVLFAGGDGTARNIMDAVGRKIPVLGIPTGCKIHSGVYALNPKSAGNLVCDFVKGKVTDTKEAEVMDIDEELFRKGQVCARLYGYLRIPYEKGKVQNLKSGSGHSEEAAISLIGNYINDTLERNTLYIIGPGSTTDSIMNVIGIPNTLLGVDLIYNRELIKSDCTESDILNFIANYKKAKIIVTVIGGQGYIFGRGNQQISAEVIRRVGKENIIVAASPEKMTSIFGNPLYVDTGDEGVNEYLKGYVRVIIGYEHAIMARVSD